MIALTVDTCLGACTVVVGDGDRVLASACEPMSRGHQERLAPMAREVMARAGVPFAALTRIGVTVGPGSFTGLRVGLAFAKGLALAVERPCVGLGTLDALAASVERAGRCAAVIDAGRGHLFVKLFDDGAGVGEARNLPLDEAADRIARSARSLWPGQESACSPAPRPPRGA